MNDAYDPEANFQQQLRDAEAKHDAGMERIRESARMRQMADDAHAKIREDNPISGLKGAEEAGAAAAGKQAGGALSPKEVKDAEDSAGLYQGDNERFRLAKKKLFSRRQEVASGLGVGTAGIAIITILTVSQTFEVPSFTNLLLEKVGHETTDIVEHRAARILFRYLFAQVQGGDRFIITGGPLDTLFSTLHANRFEDKLYRDVGVKMVREPDGRVHLIHVTDPNERNVRGVQAKKWDKGPVGNYDEIIKLAEKDQLLRRDIRRMVRLYYPVRGLLFGGDLRRALSVRYRVRYRTRDYDSSKTQEQNSEDFTSDQIDVVETESVGVIDDVADCELNDNCDKFKDNNTPVDTTKPPEVPDYVHEGVDETNSNIKEAWQEGKKEVVKTRGSITDRVREKLFTKMLGATVGATAAAAIPVIGEINDLANLVHMSKTWSENDIQSKLPAMLAEQATGAMFASWQGYSSQIQAGLMDPFFIHMLNKQAAGVGAALGYNYSEDGATTGVPLDVKINNNYENPRKAQEEWAYKLPGPTAVAIGFLDPVWYNTVGKVYNKLSALGGSLLERIFGGLIETGLKRIFGPNWKQELSQWVTTCLLRLYSIDVDPLAQGAKLFNFLYAGGDVAMNTYNQLNLGARALTPMIKGDVILENRGLNTDTSLPGNSIAQQIEDQKLDMAVLPLKYRLFSLEEPHSLLSVTLRSMPADTNALSLTSGIFRQVARLPATLLGSLTGSARAVNLTATPEQDAAIANVRQYGATTDELDQEVAPEVVTQTNPTCPEVDQNTTFNVCRADKKTVETMMCWYVDCPQFVDGSSVGYNPYERAQAGMLRNMRNSLVQPISGATAAIKALW